MANFDLRDVEFRSDGATDSLTSSMSPALFEDSLKREIATAVREERDLTIVALALNSDAFESLSTYQEALIAIAFALKHGLRAGDFFARISEVGFWALLRTDEISAAAVIDRLDLPRHESVKIHIVARKFSNYSEWIDRIDHLFFG